LLDAATDVLVSVGYGAASVDTITAAAGLSRGAMYSNFKDKTDLYLALLDRIGRDQIEQLGRRYDPDGGVGGLIDAIESGSRDATTVRAEAVLLAELWLLATRNDAVRTQLAEIQRRNIEAIASVLPDGPAPLSRSDAAAVVVAIADGLAMQRALDPTLARDGLLVDTLRLLATLEEPAP